MLNTLGHAFAKAQVEAPCRSQTSTKAGCHELTSLMGSSAELTQWKQTAAMTAEWGRPYLQLYLKQPWELLCRLSLSDGTIGAWWWQPVSQRLSRPLTKSSSPLQRIWTQINRQVHGYTQRNAHLLWPYVTHTCTFNKPPPPKLTPVPRGWEINEPVSDTRTDKGDDELHVY